MAKYLKKFENHAAYEAAESSLILPNVSICVQEDDVHYKPYVDPYAGHAYVDLGLPSGTKWATMNVGALSETDYGNYYKFGLGASQYNDSQEEYKGREKPLAASADTAVQVWGGEWHMPTSAQLTELYKNTIYTWEENFNDSGINGGKFTAQNGNYVFFPAAGECYNGSMSNVGSQGYYLSSTMGSGSVVFYLSPYSGYTGGIGAMGINSGGCSIRPVVG